MLKKPCVSRFDIVTRQTYPKDELFRLVKTSEGYILDLKLTLPGRGLYVKKDISVVRRLREKKISSRYRIPEEIIKQMEKVLSNI